MSDNEHIPSHGDPFQALLDYFEARGLHYSSDPKERRAWFFINSDHALQKCFFRFDATVSVLQIIVQYPVMVREAFRAAAAEFITRANYGLVLGNFQMDMKDGEIRYYLSHLMQGDGLEEQTIHRLFRAAMSTADRYFPGLMQVLYAGSTPEDAIYLAELDYHAQHVGETSGKPAKASSRRDKTERRGDAPSSRGSKTAPRADHGQGAVQPDAVKKSPPARRRRGEEGQTKPVAPKKGTSSSRRRDEGSGA